MTFQNGLSRSVTTGTGCWSIPNDGIPVSGPPGGSYGCFSVNQRAALDWYHPHPT
jgi:hypothetical protein